MGNPAQFTITGTTGIVYWQPDWMQNPFSVGVALLGSATLGTASIDATLQSIDPTQPNGTSPANATWFPVIQSSTTAPPAVVNWTTPVQAFRLNVSASTTGAVFTAQFVQATYGR